MQLHHSVAFVLFYAGELFLALRTGGGHFSPVRDARQVVLVGAADETVVGGFQIVKTHGTLSNLELGGLPLLLGASLRQYQLLLFCEF